MISTMPKNSHLFLKILLVAAALYAYKNRSGISHFLTQNQTIQEAKSSLKWAYNELRPQTEAEKAQHESFIKEQHKRAEEYRKVGIETKVKYVTPADPEWAETAAFVRKLKRGEKTD